jgi:hypothetical protein
VLLGAGLDATAGDFVALLGVGGALAAIGQPGNDDLVDERRVRREAEYVVADVEAIHYFALEVLYLELHLLFLALG